MKWVRWPAVVGLSAVLLVPGSGVSRIGADDREPPAAVNTEKAEKVEKTEPEAPLPTTEIEWRKRLTREQYNILRRKGTEPPFTGKYWSSKAKGVYRCAGCGQKLFGSDAKFESGTGWPSFWRPYAEENVETKVDRSHGMRRVEVVCSHCEGHLGHVFTDGPPPTGLRFCINSAALELETTARATKGSPGPARPAKSGPEKRSEIDAKRR